jgi:hypothetical protein
VGWSLDRTIDARVAPISLGPDSFAWIANGAEPRLTGARFGHRGALTHDPCALISSEAGDSCDAARLIPLSPDRSPATRTGEDRVTFTERGLTLWPRTPAATVWVTDTRYDALTVTIKLTSGISSDSLPVLRLGTTTFGDQARPWPPRASQPDVELSLVREGTNVGLVAGDERLWYDGPSGPVPFGISAGATEVTLTSLRVDRH